jgi:hypothetical protein
MEDISQPTEATRRVRRSESEIERWRLISLYEDLFFFRRVLWAGVLFI